MNFNSSRMLIFKIEKNRLSLRASLDRLAEEIEYNSALEYYGSLDTHLYWIGLSRGSEGFAQIFDYDAESKKLKEVRELRVVHQELNPLKIFCFERALYYLGDKKNLIKLRIDNFSSEKN